MPKVLTSPTLENGFMLNIDGKSAYKSVAINGKKLRITVHSSDMSSFKPFDNDTLYKLVKYSLILGLGRVGREGKESIKTIRFEGSSIVKVYKNKIEKTRNYQHYQEKFEKAKSINTENSTEESKKLIEKRKEKINIFKFYDELWKQIFAPKNVVEVEVNNDHADDSKVNFNETTQSTKQSKKDSAIDDDLLGIDDSKPADSTVKPTKGKSKKRRKSDEKTVDISSRPQSDLDSAKRKIDITDKSQLVDE